MSQPPPGPPPAVLARRRELLHDHRRALVWAAVLIVALTGLFVLMANAATREPIDAIDRDVLAFAERIRTDVIEELARALDLIGSVWITTPVRIGVAIWLIARRRWAALTAWVMTWILVEVGTTLLKQLYDRPRPAGTLVATSGASFPSGHASATAATAVSLVIVLRKPGRRRLRWELTAVGLSLLMACSRVVLGAHWLSDTIGGVLLGTAIAVASAALVSEVREFWWRHEVHENPDHAPPEPGPL